MKERVLKTIREYKLIEKNDNILVGVSGGPDSMCLLHVLVEIQDAIPFNIFVAHVNHGVRGKDADEDEEFVRLTCEKMNIPFYSEKVDMNGYARKHKMSSEEAGRKLRYDFFNEVLFEIGGGKIAVAHNKNDQAETLIMRIIRGTGIDGLKGMKFLNGNIIRPLLNVTRKEIEEYISKNNIEVRIDKTNLEPKYLRNRIRLEIIPYIEREYNPNFLDGLSRLSRTANLDCNFLDKYSSNIYKKIVKTESKNSIILNRNDFLKEHKSIKQRIIKLCLMKVADDINGITEKNISDTMVLFDKGDTGKSIDLSNGLIAKTSYGEIIIQKRENKEFRSFSYKMRENGVNYVPECKCYFEMKVAPIEKVKLNFKNMYIKSFDYDKIYGELIIRNRISGDKFKPYGMNGTKKLKDYFIDEKIPKNLRESIPIIADEKNILWIVGYRTNEEYKITSNTKKVLVIKCIKK